MTRRQVIAIAVALLVVAVVVGSVRTRQSVRDRCGAGVSSLSAGESRTPFLDAAGRAEQPDAVRDRAVEALGSGRLGAVVGAVGYYYEQWAQLSAYAQGIGVRTRNNPDFTMLDDQTLRPRWSVRIASARSTYDASDRTYLVATQPRTRAPTLVALDADTGERQWCAVLGGGPVGAEDPFATQLLDGDRGSGSDGVALLTGGDSGLRLARLDERGRRQWTRRVTADRGDHLGTLSGRLLVLGGRSAADLADPRRERPGGVAVRAVERGTGATAWRYRVPPGTAVHVVGTSGDVTVLDQHAGATSRLVALDASGEVSWAGPSSAAGVDTTVRGGRVLARTTGTWSAYDALTGRLLWRRAVPTQPQLLPYGFALDAVPMLDANQALVATTTALRVLDLRTGRFTVAAPLPTDGVSTTFWPYQVVVSPRLIAVATNTSALLLRR